MEISTLKFSPNAKLDGELFATLRLMHKHYYCGNLFRIEQDGVYKGTAIVIAVRRIKLHQVSANIACWCSNKSAIGMKEAFKKTYPDVDFTTKYLAFVIFGYKKEKHDESNSIS